MLLYQAAWHAQLLFLGSDLWDFERAVGSNVLPHRHIEKKGYLNVAPG
jgi:hypothetical protein